MWGPATKRDYLAITVIAILSALFALPILENIHASFWQFTLPNLVLLFLGSVLVFNLGLAVASAISLRFPGFFQFGKYVATGVMNSLTDIGVLNLESIIFSVFAGPWIILFNVISFLIAVTHSYFWSNLWVFKKDGVGSTFAGYLKFASVTLVGLLLNTAIVYLFTSALHPPATLSAQLWENLAKLVAVPVSVLWNFLGYKFFVFK